MADQSPSSNPTPSSGTASSASRVMPELPLLSAEPDGSSEFERPPASLSRSTQKGSGEAVAPPNKIDLANRRLGTILDDKWKLDRLLGVGGMAAVYAATHRNGAKAAIKLLPFSMATGPEVCQRLLREGYLANRIRHSAVAQVLDDHIDYAKEHAYIVMELLDGETARQRVERLGPFRPRPAVELMKELADCLSAAHAANVIHRDIKPENLFLTDKGLKVLDFGIARALDGNSSLTQTGTSLGTPAYMAPEQARGKQAEIGPRSDLYSVGATLLFLLTGQTPHRGENALELMVRAAWTPAESARKLCPGLPEALADVIDRCCAFEPDERYQSAEELRRALDRLTGLPEAPLALELTFTPTGTNASQSLPVASSDQDTVAEAELGRTPAAAPRRGWWVWGAAFGAMGLISVLAFALSREHEADHALEHEPAVNGEAAVWVPATIAAEAASGSAEPTTEVEPRSEGSSKATPALPTGRASEAPHVQRPAPLPVSKGAPKPAAGKPTKTRTPVDRVPGTATASEPKSKVIFPEKSPSPQAPSPTSNLPKINYHNIRVDKSPGHQP